MKYFITILTIFIICLGFSPCADMGIPIPKISTEEADHEHNQSQDDCTPFCVCQCCGIFFTLHPAIPVVENNNVIDYSYVFHYNNQYSLEYLNSIWQPPTFA